MKLSQAIYRISKLARIMDVEGCEEDVEALNMATVILNTKLKEEQVEIAIKHVIRPHDKRLGNDTAGIHSRLKGRLTP